MKLYRNTVTITMFFLFVLLWMALFIDASENIQDLGGNHITQKLQQADIITQKFTNEEIAILATMDENELYESIQELHKERVKSTLTQPTMSKSRQNHILTMETSTRKHTIMQYLTLRDIIPFGVTCKTLYEEVFGFEVKQGIRTLSRFCTMDIPARIVPYLNKSVLYFSTNQLKNIKMISSNNDSFAALTIDGNVVTWGNQDHVVILLPIKMIYSTNLAFAALAFYGNVVTWGNQDHGGNSTYVQNQLRKIKMIYSTNSAFAALASIGNVVTWGNQNDGGNSMSVQHQLKNITMIFSTNSAFAALTIDGNVVTWGNQDHGGNSTAVQDQLKNVRGLNSTSFSFTAFTADGNSVTWGNPTVFRDQKRTVQIFFSETDMFMQRLK